VQGAASSILRTLERFGFQWQTVVRQSERSASYDESFAALRRLGLLFACSCSRAQLEPDTPYPGTCRNLRLAHVQFATRIRVEDGNIGFLDRIQGHFAQSLKTDVGDFILKRRDQLYAYQLAVVVDDAEQGVTDVVRGADLLDNTPRQIYLQRLLGYREPRYAHVPVLCESDGRKLAKSARSVSVGAQTPLTTLVSVFGLLGLPTMNTPQFEGIDDAWRWAVAHWQVKNVPKRLNLQLSP
jgi:glutamyl-Q tRNA(Asp) synthetase